MCGNRVAYDWTGTSNWAVCGAGEGGGRFDDWLARNKGQMQQFVTTAPHHETVLQVVNRSHKCCVEIRGPRAKSRNAAISERHRRRPKKKPLSRDGCEVSQAAEATRALKFSFARPRL